MEINLPWRMGINRVPVIGHDGLPTGMTNDQLVILDSKDDIVALCRNEDQAYLIIGKLIEFCRAIEWSNKQYGGASEFPSSVNRK